jgi:hypothetical protein
VFLLIVKLFIHRKNNDEKLFVKFLLVCLSVNSFIYFVLYFNLKMNPMVKSQENYSSINCRRNSVKIIIDLCDDFNETQNFSIHESKSFESFEYNSRSNTVRRDIIHNELERCVVSLKFFN